MTERSPGISPRVAWDTGVTAQEGGETTAPGHSGIPTHVPTVTDPVHKGKA